MPAYEAHIGHDNPVGFFLKSLGVDDVAAIQDADEFTRFVLELDDGESVTSWDSDTEGLGDGDVFDNTQTMTTPDGSTAVALRIRVGLLTGITAGSKKGRIVCYDTDHPNGLVWGKPIKIKVFA